MLYTEYSTRYNTICIYKIQSTQNTVQGIILYTLNVLSTRYIRHGTVHNGHKGIVTQWINVNGLNANMNF